MLLLSRTSGCTDAFLESHRLSPYRRMFSSNRRKVSKVRSFRHIHFRAMADFTCNVCSSLTRLYRECGSNLGGLKRNPLILTFCFSLLYTNFAPSHLTSLYMLYHFKDCPSDVTRYNFLEFTSPLSQRGYLSHRFRSVDSAILANSVVC